MAEAEQPVRSVGDIRPPEVAQRITRSLVNQLTGIVRDSGASAIFVYADALREQALPLPEDFQQRVYYLTRSKLETESQASAEAESKDAKGRHFMRVPNVPLTRLGQIKVAIFLALARGLIHPGEIIACLSGLAGSGSLDTVILLEVGDEFEVFSSSFEDQTLPGDIQPEVVERVLDVASELGNEGREGRPVGAMFVIGDTERVRSMSQQLILNPFHGYPDEERHILDARLEETVKELASIDGAFLVRGDGVMESAGAYLKVSAQDSAEMPSGLGARHHAAAAITGLADAIAVTVSESTGTVTVFRGGRIVTEIEKPRSAAPTHELRVAGSDRRRTSKKRNK